MSEKGRGLVEDNDIFANRRAGVAILKEGAPLVKGLEVTAFTNIEEDQAGATAWVKGNSVFMEDEFAKLGAVFKKGDPWTAHVCKAGNLITAQNPQSADACAAAVIAALVTFAIRAAAIVFNIPSPKFARPRKSEL